ncbi:MAG TPA: hypothetical protein VIL35_06945 [Vicinamibacterales bacterium]
MRVAGNQEPGFAPAVRRHHVEAAAFPFGAEHDAAPVGREGGLAIVRRVPGEPHRIAAIQSLHPDVEMALVAAIGGVCHPLAVGRQRRLGTQVGAGRQSDQRSCGWGRRRGRRIGAPGDLHEEPCGQRQRDDAHRKGGRPPPWAYWPGDGRNRLAVAMHGSHETVPAARQGLDEARGLGGVAERVAQPPDRGVQTMLEIDERVVRPETFPERFARHQLAGLFEQHREQLQGLLLEVEPRARLPQLAGTQIELEDAEPDQSARVGRGLVHGARPDGPERQL